MYQSSTFYEGVLFDKNKRIIVFEAPKKPEEYDLEQFCKKFGIKWQDGFTISDQFGRLDNYKFNPTSEQRNELNKIVDQINKNQNKLALVKMSDLVGYGVINTGAIGEGEAICFYASEIKVNEEENGFELVGRDYSVAADFKINNKDIKFDAKIYSNFSRFFQDLPDKSIDAQNECTKIIDTQQQIQSVQSNVKCYDFYPASKVICANCFLDSIEINGIKLLYLRSGKNIAEFSLLGYNYHKQSKKNVRNSIFERSLYWLFKPAPRYFFSYQNGRRVNKCYDLIPLTSKNYLTISIEPKDGFQYVEQTIANLKCFLNKSEKKILNITEGLFYLFQHCQTSKISSPDMNDINRYKTDTDLMKGFDEVVDYVSEKILATSLMIDGQTLVKHTRNYLAICIVLYNRYHKVLPIKAKLGYRHNPQQNEKIITIMMILVSSINFSLLMLKISENRNHWAQQLNIICEIYRNFASPKNRQIAETIGVLNNGVEELKEYEAREFAQHTACTIL
jgi:hypothetical protein